MEFLAYFFDMHIDFNVEITDDETTYIISGNYDTFFDNLIDLAEDTGAKYRVTGNNYLIITTKQTYKINSQFRALGY